MGQKSASGKFAGIDTDKRASSDRSIAGEKPTFRYKSSLDECIGDYALIDDAQEIVTPMNCG